MDGGRYPPSQTVQAGRAVTILPLGRPATVIHCGRPVTVIAATGGAAGSVSLTPPGPGPGPGPGPDPGLTGAYFGPMPTNAIPNNAGVIKALSDSLANPQAGSVMIAQDVIGSWGPCFAYPASLPAATITGVMVGDVTASFTPLSVAGYRVYYLMRAIAAPTPGTPYTLTINAARRSDAAIGRLMRRGVLR